MSTDLNMDISVLPGANALARAAALAAAAALPDPDPVPTVAYRSQGRVLVTGSPAEVAQWQDRLQPPLVPSVLPVRLRDEVDISGHLGAFLVRWRQNIWPAIAAPCTDVITLEPFNNFTDNAWTLSATPPTIAGGRTGTAAEFTNLNRTADYTIPAPAESDTVTIGFAWKGTTFANANTNIAELRSDTGATQHNQLRITSGGSIAWNSAGAASGGPVGASGSTGRPSGSRPCSRRANTVR